MRVDLIAAAVIGFMFVAACEAKFLSSQDRWFPKEIEPGDRWLRETRHDVGSIVLLLTIMNALLGALVAILVLR